MRELCVSRSHTAGAPGCAVSGFKPCVHVYVYVCVYMCMCVCLYLCVCCSPQRIRAANFRQLVSTLEQVKREFSEWITRRIAEENKALTIEKASFHALKARAAAEAKETLAFAKLR